MKKIAIIGSGIAGVSSSYYLNKLGYDIHLFESGDYFGGHTNTVDVEVNSTKKPIDTGFLVHNDITYPNLIKFFEELQIETYESEMTFSVDYKHDDILWAGDNLKTVFAQRKNIFRLKFYKFLFEVLKFNFNSKKYLAQASEDKSMTIKQLLCNNGFSDNFSNWYLLPMGGCIWSTPVKNMFDFPAYTFLIFCMNHGLLQIFNRPKWKTIVGGCRTYVEKALENITNKFVNESVVEVKTFEDKVILKTNKTTQVFDYVIFATHPPQTIEIFKNIDTKSKEVLSSFTYEKNIAVLHSDEMVLPKNKSTWSAWNFFAGKDKDLESAVAVNYLINKLQPIDEDKNFIVSLNPLLKIDESKKYKTINYEHPLFNVDAIEAQGKLLNIQGAQNVFYAGAWARYGFHEDGILSGKIVVNLILKQNGQEDIFIYG